MKRTVQGKKTNRLCLVLLSNPVGREEDLKSEGIGNLPNGSWFREWENRKLIPQI